MSSPTHKNLDSLIEQPESGALEIGGGKITRTRIYAAKLSVCESNVVFEGAAGSGDESGYVVSRCSVTPLGSEQGQLTIVFEAAGSGSGATLPPDEVSVQPDNQNPRVERHPIFKPLEGQTVSGESVLAIVQSAVLAQDSAARTSQTDKLDTNPLAQKLVEKLLRGQESFYMATFRYSWATHSWSVPSISRGGFRQSPLGPLAGYFVSDIDWLREADDLQYNNGIWRWTRTWQGAPGATFDVDLY